ncbi:MAG: FAD-binding oxidoreductase [Verrucomicrobia bacterium]|nr:MAG: FAD-binding oxidoreductase [Verrucomicrobiota bacterium]
MTSESPRRLFSPTCSPAALNRRKFIQLGAAAFLMPMARGQEVTAETPIYFPESAGYRDACRLFNSRLKPKPTAVMPCLTEDDVISGVHWARKQKKNISIKSGGHCFEGYCMADDTLSLDLSKMNSMSLDPKTQIFTVAPGAKLRQINDFLLAKGRVLPAGSCAGVGIGGLTLGGGYGLLARQYGLTCDQLLGLRMIDAEGIVHQCEGEHELLKACRGGGNGNFGVITQFRFRTQKAPSHLYHRRFKVTGLTPEKAKILLETWFVATELLPRDAFSAFVLNGKCLTILLTHTNLKSQGTITAMMKPLEKLVSKTTRYYAPLYPAAIKTYYGRSGPLPFKNACAGMLQGFAEIKDIAESLARHVAKTPGVIWQVNTLGGAIQDPAFAAASVFAHRDCSYMSEIQGYWDDAAGEPIVTKAVDAIQAQLAQHGITRHYCNYPDNNFTNPQTAYFGNLDFLQKIKRQFDPTDLFHHPQGVRL